jgi:hypothetical protein
MGATRAHGRREEGRVVKDTEKGGKEKESQKRIYSDFLGVAFFPTAFFFGVAFLGGCGAVDLVTRPDFVCPRTLGWSTTAGAWRYVRLGY